MILNIVIILITRILKTIVSSYSFFSSHSILFCNFLKFNINIFKDILFLIDRKYSIIKKIYLILKLKKLPR
jgi:hypothetical protein